MKIEVRPEVRRSWFDPVGSRHLAARCAERLDVRCKGEHGLFLTLSYAREPWESARDCYHSASEDRHVRRFIEALGQYVWWSMPESERPYTPQGKPANPLNGKWVCKLEFQKDGFPHWHLLVVGLKYLSHDRLTDLWGHGWTWVARMTRKRVRYMSKYVAKAGDLPAWLYLEPTRSVKFIRASPGFWRDTVPVERIERPERQRLSAYESIGHACHRATQRTQVINAHKHRRVVARAFHEVVALAMLYGYRCSAGSPGWLCLERTHHPRHGPGASGRPAEGGPHRPPGLHLTDKPNPPPDPLGWLVNSLRSLSDDPHDHA